MAFWVSLLTVSVMFLRLICTNILFLLAAALFFHCMVLGKFYFQGILTWCCYSGELHFLMNYGLGAKIGMLSPFLFEPLVDIHCIYIGEGRLGVCSFNNLIPSSMVSQHDSCWNFCQSSALAISLCLGHGSVFMNKFTKMESCLSPLCQYINKNYYPRTLIHLYICDLLKYIHFYSQVTLEAPAPACSMWDAPLRPARRCGTPELQKAALLRNPGLQLRLPSRLRMGPQELGSCSPSPLRLF